MQLPFRSMSFRFPCGFCQVPPRSAGRRPQGSFHCHTLALWAAVFLYACTPAPAQESATATAEAALLWWVLAAELFLGLAVGIVWLVKSSRPNPPLHKEYAAREHDHPELVTRPELNKGLADLKDDFSRRLEEGARRDERTDEKLDAIGRKISEGFSNVHRRIDPMAEALAVNTAALKQHLEDHRAEKSANPNG